MVYIEEINISEMTCFTDKMKYYFMKIFCIIQKEEYNNKIKYKITRYKNKCKIISKLIKKINTKYVVLDNELLKNASIRNMFNASNINILDGKELFRYLILDSIELIQNLCGRSINTMEISILANDIDSLDRSNIVEISQIAKRVNLITNHLDKYKKIEEDILSEYGILINIANNKRKSLKNSDIIINFDMPEELINKYNINQKSVFINISEQADIKRKIFNGINILNYEINWDDEYDDIFLNYSKFQKNILYESLLKNNEYVHNINKIKEDNIKISEFIGVRGKINKEEFKILKKY